MPMTPAQLAERDYLTKLELKEKEVSAAEQAKTSLLKFTMYTNKEYEANWHHKVLCAYLDAFVESRIKRLMVFMPPRHGKSELISRRLPPYIHGRNPDEQIILASYAASLANAMNLDCQSIMDSKEYKSVFPNSPLLEKGMQFEGRTPKRTQDYYEIADPQRKGSLKTVGVGGPLTGFGFTKGIIDDPFKNRQEADSETTREMVIKWYSSTFLTRQNDKDAGICVLMTRWHEGDLCGHLLEQMQKDPNADQWVILNLPAIADDPDDRNQQKHLEPWQKRNRNDKRVPGEALWPSKYPLSYLEKQRKADERDFAALFQQSPYTEGGAILKRHYWKYYQPHELPKFLDEQVLSVDCAFKDYDTSDWVVMQVWGRKGADKYLIDQVRQKLDFNGTCDALLSLVQKYPKARAKYVEDKANGTAVMNSMKRRISGFIEVEPEGSKVARAQAVSPQLRSGNVWLPVPETAPFREMDNSVNDFVNECAKFPNGKHDDQVDCCTQALNELEKNEGIDIRKLTSW